MRIHKFYAFQTRAITELHQRSSQAHQFYGVSKVPQVVSFTAPTGAGKTIMMASMMENVFIGTEQVPEQPDAIFVWLSDSPELNQQSRDKIDLKSDKIRLDQCVTISEDSFDREYLEDGHIYFLNTQKLGRSSNLVRHSDTRQWTIWETLANTVAEKSDRLYFIIDEAHRGAKTNQTTIMQKFVKGSPADGLPPMPVVIGMSATSDRFNALMARTQSTLHQVVVTPDQVRESGLLKDTIHINYPGHESASEMAVLEAAADNWKHKVEHWKLFCDRYHNARIEPIFLIQVENGTASNISNTDLDVCLQRIMQRTGYSFSDGEVVHTFGQTTSTLQLAGINVAYLEPSKINEDRRVRVVFFKENLSTGWDCPRAEAMMSFRKATDATYIAQLLGRMVRTPLGARVASDESLNDVHLFLPYFDQDTVDKVVKALQDVEGGALPTDFVTDSIDGQFSHVLSAGTPLRRRVATQVVDDSQLEIPGLFTFPYEEDMPQNNTAIVELQETPEQKISPNKTVAASASTTSVLSHREKPVNNPKTITIQYDFAEIDRMNIIRFINNLALTTYNIRNTQITEYLRSAFDLSHFLSQTKIDSQPLKSLKGSIVEMIHQYAEKLRIQGEYDELKAKVTSLELRSKVFDVFGQKFFQGKERNLYSKTEENIDIQLRHAENALGKEGISTEYGKKYFDADAPNDYKIDVILFTLCEHCMDSLRQYAKGRFHEMNDTYRRAIVRLDPQKQKRFSDIVKDGSKVSEVNFVLPEAIAIKKAETSENGILYNDHLYVDEKTGGARIRLNGWEEDVIREEERRSDFVCWYRNPARGTNALCLKYIHNGAEQAFYPDFIIVRKDATDGYVIDILEPHNSSYDDNVGKAKALAEYAQKHSTTLGRVEMIRATDKPHEYVRLDMCRSVIREKVLQLHTSEDLNYLFDKGEITVSRRTYAREIPKNEHDVTIIHNHNEFIQTKYDIHDNPDAKINIDKI